MNKAFRAATDSAIQKIFEGRPLLASVRGATGYDDQIDDWSEAGRARRASLLTEALADLEPCDSEALSDAERLDLRLLRSWLAAENATEAEIRPGERCASAYVAALGGGLLGTLSRPGASVKARATSLLARLEKVEGYLVQAARNLGSGYDVPLEWTELAVEMLDGLDRDFRERLTPFAATAGPLAERLGDAVEGNRRKLLRFRAFLTDQLLPLCDGSFAAGRTHLELLLEKRFGLHDKIEVLMGAMGTHVDRARKSVQQALAALGTRSLRKGVQDLMQARCAALGKTGQAYARELERARATLSKRGIAHVPSHDPLPVAPLPRYLSPLVTSCTLAPAPIQGRRVPALWVRVVERTDGEKLRAVLQSEHSLPQVQVRAAGTGYPGEGLLSALAIRQSKVRRLCCSRATWTGFGLLAIDRMVAARVLRGPKSLLAAARWKLQCAVAAELDLTLHLRLTSFADAAARLEQTCLLPPAVARAAVRRLVTDPGAAVAAIAGRESLREAMHEYRERAGDRFDQREVYDRAAPLCGLPAPQLRTALLR